MSKSDYIKGRGAQLNPQNRFLSQEKGEEFDDLLYEEEVLTKTKFIDVFPKTIVNEVKSSQVPLYYSMNPYQGCEHGCIYCYARPSHQYWGYSAGVDFESVILVKKNAPELLRKTLSNKNWKVNSIGLSGNTDCYQPIERKLGITRELLKVLLEFKHPVSMITKNALILRDLDLLEELAKLELVGVSISITSVREDLRSVLEPRTSSIRKKLETIQRLTEVGVPVNVMMAPIIPALNDDEIFDLTKMVAEAGALSVNYQIVRLLPPNDVLFENWLEHHFPDRSKKVLNQLRAMHGGKLYGSMFNEKKEDPFSLNVAQQFEIARKKFLKGKKFPSLRKDLFQVPGTQMRLF